MKRLLIIIPVGFLLSGCVTAAQLNEQIPGDSATAEISAPADPCPDVPSPPGAQARSMGGAPSPLPPPPTTRAGGTVSDLDLGVALIAGSAGVDGRAGGDPGMRAYSQRVEQNLGFDLAQFADQIDSIDATGSKDADHALSSPGFIQAQAAFASPIGRAAGPAQPVDLSLGSWAETTKLIARTTAEDGWTASFAENLGRFANGENSGRAADVRQSDLKDLQKKYLIAAYMAAYFRNGQIVSLDFNQTDLKAQLLAKLKDTIKDANALKAADDEINSLASDYEKALCAKGKDAAGNCVLVGVIGEKTFVTRAGKSYGFPGITATIDPTASKKISTNKIASDDVVSDLVRVVFEATGDSIIQVPGAKNSTLCDFDPQLCATDAEAATLQKVNDTGDKVEAGSTAAVGAAIRGSWLFSLNNETLAKSITTGVSVGLRKTAEGIAWKKANAACPAGRALGGSLYRTVTFKLTQ